MKPNTGTDIHTHADEILLTMKYINILKRGSFKTFWGKMNLLQLKNSAGHPKQIHCKSCNKLYSSLLLLRTRTTSMQINNTLSDYTSCYPDH